MTEQKKTSESNVDKKKPLSRLPFLGPTIRDKKGVMGRRIQSKITSRLIQYQELMALFSAEMASIQLVRSSQNLILKRRKKKLLPMPDASLLAEAQLKIDAAETLIQLGAFECADMALDTAWEKLLQIIAISPVSQISEAQK